MDKPRIYNKNLGIDDVIVQNETDLSKLTMWRDELYIQMSVISAGVNDPKQLKTNTFVYYRYAKTLYKLVKARIADIRCSTKNDFCRTFVDCAKKLLSEEEYKMICADVQLTLEAKGCDWFESEEEHDPFNSWE